PSLRQDCTPPMASVCPSPGRPLVSASFSFWKRSPSTGSYPLSLHDALPIFTLGSPRGMAAPSWRTRRRSETARSTWTTTRLRVRSEEHTSELQSRENLVCRLLLEKKKQSSGGLPPRPAAGSRERDALITSAA